ncbi:RusA family crossover junction endodeoxyribonuclease [Paraburkholderia panacisoli]|uniref:RusA family crossover junction endodeoxyribonuclease n=2 Tax=Paraburkholderia panacisoli TaxID=2603818 RepID=A0A5B0HE67_9BURK|nr:RusA family crossover junction endodeoxyribonuclease [Paraburkholderia panacisoli]KAA1013223.1 RusA family crossover junction endodeoxyribonuclease [Paraburkholderia panacisoli]
MKEMADSTGSSANGVMFTVPGVPVGKGRPRFARRGNFVSTYTPAKTASYENLVKMAAVEAMDGAAPMKRPLSMLLTIHMPIPESWSKKRKDLAVRGLIGATVKPDWDNVGKLVADAMNGIAYVDDKQIVSATVAKQYGTVPHIAVRIQEYAEREAA